MRGGPKVWRNCAGINLVLYTIHYTHKVNEDEKRIGKLQLLSQTGKKISHLFKFCKMSCAANIGVREDRDKGRGGTGGYRLIMGKATHPRTQTQLSQVWQPWHQRHQEGLLVLVVNKGRHPMIYLHS